MAAVLAGDIVITAKLDRAFRSAADALGTLQQLKEGKSAKDLQARCKPLIRKSQPYAKKIAHRGFQVEPSLLAEVEYRAKSAEGKVRHPVFKGSRRSALNAPTNPLRGKIEVPNI